jgi:hypothetical protein
MTLGAGLNADGILSANAASIWARNKEAEGITGSPYIRLSGLNAVKLATASKAVQYLIKLLIILMLVCG